MSLLTALGRFFGQYQAGSINGSAYNYRSHVEARTRAVELPPQELYALLRRFYLSNGMYDELARSSAVVGRSSPHLKSIRNPVVPVVDFFSLKLLPDPLVIVTERPAIIDPIEQVWAWSNWGQNRRLFGRYVALFGEAYLKVVASQERGRVWFEVISPEHVTEFEADERGYLTMIRLDVCREQKTAAGVRRYTYTEHWSKDDDLYQSWETEGHDTAARSLDDLGPPLDAFRITDLGIDFLPFTRTVFRDLGECRGIGAVQLALEAIVEADLSATNLHGTLYQDAEGAWVLKSVGVDAAGRPLPPPIVGPSPTDGTTGRQSDDSVTVGKRSFWRLPGNQELQSVVPDIAYDAALAILQDHDQHLERLMPALAYSRVGELSGGDLSGRAIRFKLTPLVDQVAEVRANAVSSLVRADMMALTLAQANGLPEFAGLGTFEAGAFEHEFEDTEIVPTSDYEEAQTLREQATAFSTFATAGLPFSENLTRTLGMTEEEAADVAELADQEAAEAQRQQLALAEASRPPAPGRTTTRRTVQRDGEGRVTGVTEENE